MQPAREQQAIRLQLGQPDPGRQATRVACVLPSAVPDEGESLSGYVAKGV